VVAQGQDFLDSAVPLATEAIPLTAYSIIAGQLAVKARAATRTA